MKKLFNLVSHQGHLNQNRSYLTYPEKKVYIKKEKTVNTRYRHKITGTRILLVREEIGTATWENCLAVHVKAVCIHTIWHSNLALIHTPNRNAYTRMQIVTSLLIMALIWKQHKCSLTEEWIYIVWCSQTTE